MLALNRILVALDFSPASEAALNRALDLASRTKAEVHVLHAVPGPHPSQGVVFHDVPGDDRTFYRRLWHEADSQLTAILDEVKLDGISIHRKLAGGVPYRVIIDYARREEIDLLVMGTHGRRGLSRFFLGSVAGEVLRRTDVPVLIVPVGVPGQRPLRRVVAPTDFSDASRLALPLAAELAGLYGADLEVLHAFEPPRYLESIAGSQLATDILPGLRAEAERRLEELAETPGLLGALSNGRAADAPVEGGGGVLARIYTHLADGRAAEAIVAAARKSKCDVIVMAKRGLHGVERLLVGSVTERVCRLAPCAVLVVPIGDDDDEQQPDDPAASNR